MRDWQAGRAVTLLWQAASRPQQAGYAALPSCSLTKLPKPRAAASWHPLLAPGCSSCSSSGAAPACRQRPQGRNVKNTGSLLVREGSVGGMSRQVFSPAADPRASGMGLACSTTPPLAVQQQETTEKSESVSITQDNQQYDPQRSTVWAVQLPQAAAPCTYLQYSLLVAFDACEVGDRAHSRLLPGRPR